jgi:hypothetical protein
VFVNCDARSQFTEELFKYFRTLILKYACCDLGLVVETGVLQDIKVGTGTSGFRAHAADKYTRDAGLDDSAGTHLTWFKGHIHVTVLETPVSNAATGPAYRDKLRMRKCILIGFTSVVSAPYHRTVMYDNTADRDFSE